MAGSDRREEVIGVVVHCLYTSIQCQAYIATLYLSSYQRCRAAFRYRDTPLPKKKPFKRMPSWSPHSQIITSYIRCAASAHLELYMRKLLRFKGMTT